MTLKANRRRTARTAMVAAAMLAFSSAATVSAQDLVLGLSFAKTGRYASIGAPTEVAVDIAVSEINAKGGVNGKKIRVEKFDTGSEAKNAQIATQRLAEDAKALAIIGPFSSQEAQVAFAAGERLKVVQMPNASSAPGLTKDRPWAFRMTEDEGKQFARLVRTLESKKLIKDKTAAIFYTSDEVVGKALGTIVMPKVLKGAGWKIVDEPIGFQTAAFDLSPQVSKLAGQTPSIVAFGGLHETAIKLVRELNRQGIKGTLVGSQVFADPDIAEKLGPDGEGTLFMSWYWWDLNDRTRAFEKKFIEAMKKYSLNKTGAHHVDASAYDIVYVFADAMRRAGVTGDPAKLEAERNAVREALLKTNYEGISGHICFDKDRDAELAGYVIGIKNGHRQLIDIHPSDKCS